MTFAFYSVNLDSRQYC